MVAERQGTGILYLVAMRYYGSMLSETLVYLKQNIDVVQAAGLRLCPELIGRLAEC